MVAVQGLNPGHRKGALRVSEGQGGTMPPEPLGTGSGTGCQYEWGFRKAEGSLAKVRRLSEMKGLRITRNSEKVLPEANWLAQGL